MRKNISEKTCLFYVSDYHFEMIGLLNINKEMKENKKVIVLTENNLEETVENLLSKIILKEEEKDKLKNINWTNDEEEKFKQLKTAIKNNDKISIYVKGSEKYIEEQNKKIEEITTKNEIKEKISITDCYNFYEIEKKSKEIVKKYKSNLVTNKKILIKK